MKKTILIIAWTVLMHTFTEAQDVYTQQMHEQVAKLDKASTIKDYEQSANDFLRIADAQKTQWLSYYYAAYCNAKIGWIKQDADPDNIETFANKAEEQINKAKALLDTTKQQKELSEVYCVYSMLNRSKVYVNPMVYGPQYGPIATHYVTMALKSNAENPRALWLAGWEKFATPKMYGGDKNKAKEILISAKQKLDSAPDTGVEPHWGKKEVEDISKHLK
jgi:hypothetical protein